MPKPYGPALTMTDNRLTTCSNKKYEEEKGRPPLMPVVAFPQMHQRDAHKAPRFFFSEPEREDKRPQYLEMDDEDKFDLMNLTVVVYSINGIICEKQSTKKRRQKLGKRGDASYRRGDSSVSKSTVGGSTISSLGVSTASDESFIENPNAPTTAVVSFRKNAFSSHTSLETFLPSLPLSLPSSTIGNKTRYGASWPSEQSELLQDNANIARSSFKLTRCMQQETFIPGETRATAAGAVSNYVHETLEIRINLSRGTELVPLGSASIVITGDEEGEVQMHVPTNPIENKPKTKKLGSRFKSKSKGNKYGYFTSDPSRRYYLDENATLRVGVQVIPQAAVKIAEEREKQDFDLIKMLERISDENLDRGDQRDMRRVSVGNMKATMSPKRSRAPPTPPNSMLPFLCGTMMCAPSRPISEPKVNDIPIEIIHTRTDIGYQYGVTSIMSSVSESTDGSNDSEPEVEPKQAPPGKSGRKAHFFY